MTILELDQSATNILYDLTRHNPSLQHYVYDVGTYLVFLVPVILVILVSRPGSRYVAAKIFGMTVITWQIFNKLLGDFLYSHYGFRDRPFAASGLKEFFFEQPQKAFPSDHAAVLLFVTLALFYYRQKSWAWIFLVITLLSSFARVAIGFHWVGDIVGGWAIGAIGFGLLVLIDKPLQRILEKAWNLISTRRNETIS